MTTAAAISPATTSSLGPPDTPAVTAAPALPPERCSLIARPRLLLRHERAAGAGELREFLLPHFGVVKIQRLERLDDRRRDGDAREPLVVGRDDVPGRMLRRRVADHVLVRVHVALPVTALPRVGRRELPVLLGIVDPIEEPTLLLLARHVEEELPDDDPVVVQVALVRAHVAVTILPDAFGDPRLRQLLV